ncbi:S-adenosyl-L-methionine-dependent methyltransferase [Mycena sanguinolenta]|uniref:S-adenosyl-L-methionine-dependent methyltransferase n=1 Tax=Mycena sanguinolenta TaxID=230812 RepID=A0A8H7D9N7_9AGAR|nr:S-adenosyl-L-methionine-dependent methyltransferase [Mycena sanguinolenta]
MDNLLQAKPEAQGTYQLPADKERERLSLQDQVWKILFGGLNPPELHEAINTRLAVRDGPPPAVLDVGCGSGGWATEMGNFYPQAHILGVDLVIDQTLNAPSNVQFKQLDITQGVPPASGGYAIIHARVVTGHLKDPAAFIRAAHAKLAPGGLMILADGYKSLWGDKTEPVPLIPGIHDPKDALPTGSWWAGWVDFWWKTGYTHYRRVASLINEQPGLSLMFQQRYLIPVHELDDDKAQKRLGAVSKSNILVCPAPSSDGPLMYFMFLQKFCYNSVDSFLATGQFTRTQIDEWLKLIENELETKRLYTPWEVACGVKLS